MTVQPDAPQTGIARFQPVALGIGVLGIAISVVGFVSNRAQFFRSWLPSYLFWFSIVGGALAVLMLQYVTGGEWGLMIRRPLGAAARTMWVMLLLFIPIAVGFRDIYPWANTAWEGFNEIHALKGKYLNPQFFFIRVAVYFAFFLIWAWRIRVLSLEFYRNRSPYTELSRRKWAASGLVLVVLTMTFLSIDWMMSTEPKWSSTMYGITFTVGCGLSAFAFVTFFLSRLAHTDAMSEVLRPTHLRDLGNLMLAFVMLWAYFGFSQYLIIWAGNLPQEIAWYAHRLQTGWRFIGIALIVFHFAIPFVLLLSRTMKREAGLIVKVAIGILFVRLLDLFWLIAPEFHTSGIAVSWVDLVLPISLGALWLGCFISQLRRRTILPAHDPEFEEALGRVALT